MEDLSASIPMNIVLVIMEEENTMLVKVCGKIVNNVSAIQDKVCTFFSSSKVSIKENILFLVYKLQSVECRLVLLCYFLAIFRWLEM